MSIRYRMAAAASESLVFLMAEPGVTAPGLGGTHFRKAIHTMSNKLNPTPGPWQVCEFGPEHVDALPGEVGVFAPEHFDSHQLQDGTWHGVTVCRGMTGPAKHDNATLIACVPEMIEVIKMAYRKHHLGDDSIGWDELSEKLGDVLSNAMGVESYVEWQEEITR